MSRCPSPGALTGSLLALALLPVFWPGDAKAQACTDKATDLIAGRTIDAGNINVCNDDTTLTVTYDATFPWCLLETHLHVATSESDIPQNKKGNPIPGHFGYGNEYDCEGTVTFEILLADIGAAGVSFGDTVVIAAHAKVDDGARTEGAWGAGTRFVERGNWAMYFSYTVQDPLGCAAGGAEVGGACWFSGEPGASCTATCGAVFLSYAEATRTYAGSHGTNEHCAEVLDALNVPGGAVEVVATPVGTGGIGCSHVFRPNVVRLRHVLPPTAPDAFLPSFHRACACE